MVGRKEKEKYDERDNKKKGEEGDEIEVKEE